MMAFCRLEWEVMGMMDKQALIAELLRERHNSIKTDIIKGIEDIKPEEVVNQLIDTTSKMYIAVIGYEGITTRCESLRD